MATQIQIEVIDRRDGTFQEQALKKRFTYIGKDSKNDIVLGPSDSQTGVARKHLQVITNDLSTPRPRFRVVNLTTSKALVNDSDVVEGLASCDLGIGDHVIVGVYKLVFKIGEIAPPRPAAAPQATPAAGPARNRAAVFLRIEMRETQLWPGKSLEGIVHIRNTGSDYVNVNLKLNGLPEEKYRIESAGGINPDIELSVPLRLEHPEDPRIAPGPRKLTITAEDGLTGAEIGSTQHTIQIGKFYKHAVSLKRGG